MENCLTNCASYQFFAFQLKSSCLNFFFFFGKNESVPFIFALLYGMMLSFVREGRCRDKAGEGLFLAGSRALAQQVPEYAGPPRGQAPAGRMGNSAQRQAVFSRTSPCPGSFGA